MATTINLRDVPEDLHTEIKIQAARENLSVKALVLRVMREYLKEKGGDS